MKKFFLLMVLLFSSIVQANPMCPDIRERLMANNYSDGYVDIYFGYACENQVTSIVFDYSDKVSIDALETNSSMFSDRICQMLSKEYQATDNLGRTVMELVQQGGYTFIFRHPLLFEPIKEFRTFKECIQ